MSIFEWQALIGPTWSVPLAQSTSVTIGLLGGILGHHFYYDTVDTGSRIDWNFAAPLELSQRWGPAALGVGLLAGVSGPPRDHEISGTLAWHRGPAYLGVTAGLGPRYRRARAAGTPGVTGKPSDKITMDALYPRYAAFIQPSDNVVLESGSTSFGIPPLQLADGAQVHIQMLWGSIGWATGAALHGLHSGRMANARAPGWLVGGSPRAFVLRTRTRAPAACGRRNRGMELELEARREGRVGNLVHLDAGRRRGPR